MVIHSTQVKSSRRRFQRNAVIVEIMLLGHCCVLQSFSDVVQRLLISLGKASLALLVVEALSFALGMPTKLSVSQEVRETTDIDPFSYLYNATFRAYFWSDESTSRATSQLEFRLNADKTVTVLQTDRGHGGGPLSGMDDRKRSNKFTWQAVPPDSILIDLTSDFTGKEGQLKSRWIEVQKFLIRLPTTKPSDERFKVEADCEGRNEYTSEWWGERSDDKISTYSRKYFFEVRLDRSPVPLASVNRAGPSSTMTPGTTYGKETVRPGSFYFFGLAANRFTNDFFPSLSNCREDIFSLSELCGAISNQKEMIFVPILLEGDDLVQGEALQAMEELKSVVSAEDTLVMAFATHGVNLQRGLYLALPGSNPTSMQGTSIDWTSVANCVTSVKAGRVVVLLDACHAGSFAESNLAILQQAKQQLANRSGLTVISASDANHPALELSGESSHGAFTQALLDVLPGTGFPWEAGSAFFPRVKSQVEQLTKGYQVPVLTLDVTPSSPTIPAR